MPISLRRLLLSFMLTGTLAPSLLAQAKGQWSACRMDSLANWNCAQYYTGTVTLISDLKGSDLHESLRVVATVTGGVVTCQVKGSEVGDFEGPGMLVVEHASTENAGEYGISVWCPEEAGKRPRRGDAPVIQVTKQRAVAYATLEGKDSYEHPSADPANGLSGTETITWGLRRP